MAKTFDLGAVTAYAYAVAQGFTGTEKDFGEQLNLALQAGGYADQAEQYAQDSSDYAQASAESAAEASRLLTQTFRIEGDTLYYGDEGE